VGIKPGILKGGAPEHGFDFIEVNAAGSFC